MSAIGFCVGWSNFCAFDPLDIAYGLQDFGALPRLHVGEPGEALEASVPADTEFMRGKQRDDVIVRPKNTARVSA